MMDSHTLNGSVDDYSITLSPTSASSVPAGWYPDPHDGRVQRWWDGYRWTKHTHLPALTPDVPGAGSLYNGGKDAAAGKNSAGAWSLALGITAVVLGIPLVTALWSLLAGIAAIVWGAVGLGRSARYGVKRGSSIAGLVLGVLTVAVTLVWLVAPYV